MPWLSWAIVFVWFVILPIWSKFLMQCNPCAYWLATSPLLLFSWPTMVWDRFSVALKTVHFACTRRKKQLRPLSSGCVVEKKLLTQIVVYYAKFYKLRSAAKSSKQTKKNDSSSEFSCTIQTRERKFSVAQSVRVHVHVSITVIVVTLDRVELQLRLVLFVVAVVFNARFSFKCRHTIVQWKVICWRFLSLSVQY